MERKDQMETFSARKGQVTRTTTETSVTLDVHLDGRGAHTIDTRVPFLDHMLQLFTHHGRFDVTIAATGDIAVDDHHTVEDVGLCLGQAFYMAFGDKRGMARYGNAFVPMDEALAQVVIDTSNRPHFAWTGTWPQQTVGAFHTELVEEFLWKFALEARITLHVILHAGTNTHHCVEAVFKAFGRALCEATRLDPHHRDIPSTKGVL